MPGVPLSIVIPTHNRTDLLRACLGSVLRHMPDGAEVIVVEDGSPTSLAGEFPGVQFVRLPRQQGFCAAANAGIAAARGTIVELLNDDTEVLTGWADAALACFDDAHVVAVAPLVLNAKGAAHEVSGLRRPLTSCAALSIDSAGDGYDPGGFARKLHNGEPPTDLRRREVFGASGSSAFYRRDAVLHVGGFPEQFGAYFEDVDLSFRLCRAGGIIMFEPASRVLHHGGSSYGRPDRRLLEQQSCNEERVWWRNLTGREVLRWLPRHVAVLVAKAARRWREDMLLPWLCGRARAWSEIVTSRCHQRRRPTTLPNASRRDSG